MGTAIKVPTIAGVAKLTVGRWLKRGAIILLNPNGETKTEFLFGLEKTNTMNSIYFDCGYELPY
jgi:hypothetical protein